MKLSNGNVMWKDSVFLWTTAVGLKGGYSRHHCFFLCGVSGSVEQFPFQ